MNYETAWQEHSQLFCLMFWFFFCQEFILLLNQTPGINTVSQKGYLQGLSQGSLCVLF